NPGLIGPSSSAASRSGKTRVNVVERFAGFAEGERWQPLAPQVLHQAKRAVIDWYAALLPGGVVPPALLLERAFAGELGHGEARLALGKRASVRAAALINGAAAHTVEVDDIFREGIYHPGAPTIAAALAVAQSRQVSGEAFLRAVVVGYEISTRIAEAMGRAHYRYWHNTGTIGCFGAASAAAEVLGLDAKRFAHALATVATFSAGLQQAFRADSMSKPMHAGRAAEAGVTAALAAAEGVTGALDIMEGEAGYGRATGHGGARDGPGRERAARRVRAGAAPGPGDALAYAARGSSPGPWARCRISGAARGARRDRVARRPARRASPADAQRRPGHAALRRRARAQVPRARLARARRRARAPAARAALASGERNPAQLLPVSLAEALFAPRAVALVGASGDPAKNSARPLRFLRKHGYAGRIVPINASRGEVLGER